MTFATIGELFALARTEIPEPWSTFILSGAGSEAALERNRRALDRLAIEQVLLDGEAQIDLRRNFLGRELRLPLLTAPMGMIQFLHPDGDLAMVEGAGRLGVASAVANETAHSLTEIAKAASSPLLAQLRGATDWATQEARLAEIAASPAYTGICLTVDGPVATRIDRYIEAEPDTYPGYHPGIAVPGHRFAWADVDRIRAATKLPLGLKGIMTAGDARLSLDHGADFVWVSNHGARKMDAVRATIDVLEEVVDAVGDRIPVLVDGGFTRGSDVAKAIARGASLVAIGKASACALALGGAEGVTDLFTILASELHNAVACSGHATLRELSRSDLRTLDY